MAQRVEIPGVGVVEFPDNMSNNQIASAIQANYPELNQPQTQERSLAGTAAFLPGGAWKGIANVAGLPVDAATWTTNKFLGAIGQPTADEPLPLSSDWLKGHMYDAKMIGDPVTRTERVLDRVGQELGATAVPAGAALTAASRGATSSIPVLHEMLQAAGHSPGAFAATEAGLGLLSGAGAATAREAFPGQPMAELAGQLIPTLGVPLGAAGVRGLLRGGEPSRKALQESVETFARAGASPSVGQGTQSGGRQVVEKILANMPGGGTVMQKAAKATAEKLRTGVDDVANRISRRSGVEVAGRTIERGVSDGFVNRFQGKAGDLFSRVDKFIPAGRKVAVKNTQGALQSLTAPIEGAESTSRILTNPKVAQIAQSFLDDAKGGTIPYQALKGLRSKVGRMLTSNDLVSDVPKGELKRLYGALSEDMRGAAKDVGPEALKTFERANSYYKAGMQRIDDVLQKIANRGTPEDVFRAATRGKDGATTIRTVRRSLDPDEWDVVSSTVLRRMGRARPSAQDELGDVFSVESFLTNWNGLSKEARSALFGGTRYAGISDDLDAIATTAARVREAARTLANSSGSAGQAANLSAAMTGGGFLLAGDASVPLTIAALSGMSAGAAELLTNPRFVRWLAKSTEIPVGQLPGYIARLSVTMRDEDPETKESVQEYLGNIGGEK